MIRPHILVAGIGNIFLGDDAFGCEVAQRLLRRQLPPEVRIVDFGIRGLDLTYALLEGYEDAILIDAAPRGHAPGTLYVIEPDITAPDPSPADPMIDTHNMDPAKVLRLVAAMGGHVQRILLVGCEPTRIEENPDLLMSMSEPVLAAVGQAVEMVEMLIDKLLHRGCAGRG